MESCLLVTSRKHRLFPDVMNACRAHFDDVEELHYDDIGSTNEMMRGRDILISIYNERLFTGDQLQCVNFNIHPAPPEYPGRGSASMALFDGATVFGPVAHVMDVRPDAGPIFAARPIPIFSFDTCESLFNRSERAGVDLLTHILMQYRRDKVLPPPNGMRWGQKAMTQKAFERWMVLDQSNLDEFERKIRAVRHSVYPGPFIERDGRRLGLVPDDHDGATIEVNGYRFAEVAKKAAA